MTTTPPPPGTGRTDSRLGRWPGWLVVATALAVAAAGLLAAKGLVAEPERAAGQGRTPAASRASGPTAAAGVWPGRRAPDFAVTTATGQRFHLAAQRGHAVVLTFLAPGCTSCAEELAALTKAQDGFKDQGVAVLLVDLGGGPIDQAVAYYRRLGGGDYLYASDPGFRVARQYQVLTLGTTVVVDPAGTVAFRDEIPTPPDVLARALQQALA